MIWITAISLLSTIIIRMIWRSHEPLKRIKFTEIISWWKNKTKSFTNLAKRDFQSKLAASCGDTLYISFHYRFVMIKILYEKTHPMKDIQVTGLYIVGLLLSQLLSKHKRTAGLHGNTLIFIHKKKAEINSIIIF